MCLLPVIFGKIVPEKQADQVKQIWKDLTPVGRQGLPSDMGKAAAFLASDEKGKFNHLIDTIPNFENLIAKPEAKKL